MRRTSATALPVLPRRRLCMLESILAVVSVGAVGVGQRDLDGIATVY
jgi:hypothetical protein